MNVFNRERRKDHFTVSASVWTLSSVACVCAQVSIDRTQKAGGQNDGCILKFTQHTHRKTHKHTFTEHTHALLTHGKPLVKVAVTNKEGRAGRGRHYGDKSLSPPWQRRLT